MLKFIAAATLVGKYCRTGDFGPSVWVYLVMRLVWFPILLLALSSAPTAVNAEVSTDVAQMERDMASNHCPIDKRPYANHSFKECNSLCAAVTSDPSINWST
ncbi:hypothetical protein [Bradyrhizobium sp. LeoA1S1]